MTVIYSLTNERLRREMRIVAMAQYARETLYEAAHDLEPPADALRELIDELDWLWSDESDVVLAYKLEIADATQPVPGMPIRPLEVFNIDVDPAVHGRVLERDRECLARVESATGVPLLWRCR